MLSPEIESDLDGLPGEGTLLVGKYRLGERLGVGGMGVVIAAEHVELQQTFAVKLLLPRVASLRGARDRFVREARAAARIHGDHAVRIVDVGTTEEGVAYLVMERLHGGDLADLLEERGRLSPVEAVDLVLEAVEGVDAAHAAGLVHRDLKPSNLFLARRAGGRPVLKVLDFGISKALVQNDASPVETLTDPHAPIGSPQYMAPEQITDGRTVDARADLWSLGVILHELLSGTAPFDAASISHLYVKILHEEPAPLSVDGLPEGLGQVVSDCLVKDRERRIQTCGQLRDRLLPYASPKVRAQLGRQHDLDVAPASSVPAPMSVPTPSRRVSLGTETEGFGDTQLPEPEKPRRARRAPWVVAATLLAAGVVFLALRPAPAHSPSPGDAAAGGAPSAIASAPDPSETPTPPAVAPAPATVTAAATPTASVDSPVTPPLPATGTVPSGPTQRPATSTAPARPPPPGPPTGSGRVRGLGDIRPLD